MALARAFAQGPRPKRSLLFVWHAGEERGRYGSLYFADHPTVPLDRIVAQLNIDMIGTEPRRQGERGEHACIWSGPIASAPSCTRSAAGGQPRRCRSRSRSTTSSTIRRSRAALHAQRSLQLRVQRHSGHLLHHRPSSRLPRQHRRGVEDRVRQDVARRRTHLRDGHAAGQSRSRAGARPAGGAQAAGNGAAVTRDASAPHHLPHDLRQPRSASASSSRCCRSTRRRSARRRSSIGLLFAVFSLCQLVAAPVLGDCRIATAAGPCWSSACSARSSAS